MLGAARAFLVNGIARRNALRHLVNNSIALQCYNSLRNESTRSAVGKNNWTGDGSISHTEATKLLRLVDMDALKSKLGVKTKEVIAYSELLKACESLGVAKSPDEAASFARVLDEAGVILLFGDKVYLHPQKVVDQVRKSVHLALTTEDDPKRDEFNKLQEEKKKLDKLAHKQAVCILWSGLGIIVMQIGLFFRLTFWEFSWDVMEPVTFFATATGIIISYGYFLITSRDPTYRDFMERLFLSRQRKVFQKHGFDIQRFKELQERCKFSHAKMSLKL